MKFLVSMLLIFWAIHSNAQSACWPHLNTEMKFINMKISWTDQAFSNYPRVPYPKHFEQGYGEVPTDTPQFEFLVLAAKSKFTDNFDPVHWQRMARKYSLASYETMRQIRLLDQIFRGVQRIRATGSERRYLDRILRVSQVPI